MPNTRVGSCPSCGAAIESSHQFCPGCGEPLPQAISATAPEVKKASARSRRLLGFLGNAILVVGGTVGAALVVPAMQSHALTGGLTVSDTNFYSSSSVETFGEGTSCVA